MRTIIAVTAFIALSFSSLRADAKPTFSIEAWNLVLNGAQCPIDKWKDIAKRAETAGAKAQAADLWGAMASCYARSGNTAAGARALSRALRLGFGDCFYLKNDAAMKKLPNYTAALRSVRISPADMHELRWAVSEVTAISHDTKMMIVANMNRKDTGSTLVFPTTIPSRHTSNKTVLLYRWLLLHLMQNQRMMVMRSDQSRIRHLTNMNIIRNMGTGGSNSARMRMMSVRIAQQAARRRKASVAARAYHAKGLSTRARTCASY